MESAQGIVAEFYRLLAAAQEALLQRFFRHGLVGAGATAMDGGSAGVAGAFICLARELRLGRRSQSACDLDNGANGDGGLTFIALKINPLIDGHHVRHWADGGETRLDNLVLLCRRLSAGIDIDYPLAVELLWYRNFPNEHETL